MLLFACVALAPISPFDKGMQFISFEKALTREYEFPRIIISGKVNSWEMNCQETFPVNSWEVNFPPIFNGQTNLAPMFQHPMNPDQGVLYIKKTNHIALSPR